VERVVPWGRLCEEQEVTADAGYQGVEKREEMVAGARGGEWQIAVKRGKVRSMGEGVKALTRSLERVKAQVRARVDHPFPVLKSLFRHRKTPYRGLAKPPTSFTVSSPLPTSSWKPSEPDPDGFDQSPAGKAPEVPLDDGRILVLEST